MTRICRFFAHHRVLAWAVAMLVVTLWYFGTHAGMDLLFSVKPGSKAFPADLIAHLLIATLLFLMSHNLTRFVLGTIALFTVLTLGNALKMTILGGPVMPDDFVSARNMLMLLDGWQLGGAILMLVVPAALLGWMIAWRRTRFWVSSAATAVGVGLLLAFPGPVITTMDQRFGDWVWNQRGNFEDRGLPIHLIQEGIRSRARREPAPTAAEVAQALGQLGVTAPSELVKVTSSVPPARNVHMIVLESFWDPLLLTASKLSADPLDPAFRELWAASGHSTGLAPVFGGYTANTEHEILCGFPVERDNVFFEGGLRRSAPCLPHHLAGIGYRSFASHPNAASFWNRVNAYQRIGFQTYWSDADFELDDMNREFLSDASLYRQVLERLGSQLQGPTPVFNYVLTYFGHLPYPLNEQRPKVIQAAEGHETVAAYANVMYYKSRELMDFLGELRRLDPDALILLFGDHPPALGNQYGGFRESGLLAATRAEFSDEMFRTLVETPLVIIDGERGVLNVGALPFYQLPGLILELLGDQRPSMMALTWPPEGLSSLIRPLPGLHFITEGKSLITCRDTEDESEACSTSRRWLEAIRVLSRDIFGGDQHALRQLESSAPALRAATLVTETQPEVTRL